LATIIVALFGEWIRAKLFAPKLQLKLRDERGEKQNAGIQWMNADGTTGARHELARYYHIKVSNGTRWRPATNVQVFLTQVAEPGPDGDFKTSWVGDIPLQWRHQQAYPAARTIGSAIDCDLCNVVKDKWIELSPLIVPNNLLTRRKLPENRLTRQPTNWSTNMVVTLQARANEGESAITRFLISWDGEWEDGDIEMAKHLVVKEFKEQEWPATLGIP
jgi:hypothetical protein